MNIPSGISTLVFDLGGVIVDLDWERCVRNFKAIGVENIDTLISTTLQKGFILDYELGRISSDEFRAEVRKRATTELSDEAINNAWTSLLVGAPDEKLHLLQELKKQYNVLMLSNTNELSFAHCRDYFFNKNGKRLDDYFHKCYLSYEMHLNKPEPAIFEALLRDAGLKAEECLFLDDGMHNVEAAKRLGFQVRHIAPYSPIVF